MGAPPRLTAEQRERIYALKEKGKSGAETARLCALGFEDLPPFKVTGQRCNDVWRKMARERDTLYGFNFKRGPMDEGIRRLARIGIIIADREMERQDRNQKRGQLNGNQLSALAGALKRLHMLARDIEAEPPDSSQNGAEGVSGATEDDWMAGMLSDEEPAEP